MSFQTGTATDFLDLLAQLDTFLTAKGTAFGIAYAGTGTGALGAYSGGTASVAETITVTASSSTSFAVVGSTSGSIGTATVGTPFTSTKINFTLTAGGVAFVAGDVFTLATAPPWIQKLGPPTASSTQWRVFIEASNNATLPTRIARLEMFDTIGGTDQATGGTATASNAAGSHPASDAIDTNSATYWENIGTTGWLQVTFGSAKAIKEIAITYPTGQSSDTNAPRDIRAEYWDGTKWVPTASFRNETGWVSTERRVFRLANYIWQAPGNDGLAQILVGAAAFKNDGAGWYNARLNAFTAFDATQGWFAQQGAISAVTPFGPILPMSNTSMSYWFMANGRRVVGVVKSGSIYNPFYLGLISPYASPGQWPLPLFVGGSLWFPDEPTFTDPKWTVGNANGQHTSFAAPFSPIQSTAQSKTLWGPGRLRLPDGTWHGFISRSDFYTPKDDALLGITWPYGFGYLNLKPELDGKYGILPIMLMAPSPTNIFGQFDGVHAVTGASLSPEATIDEPLQGSTTTPKRQYVAFPDVTRSNAGDFMALRLD